MADYSLSDEITAIGAIFGEEILTADPSSSSSSSSSSQQSSAGARHYVLCVPESEGVRLRLAFPASYPASSAPRVAGTVSSGSGSGSGAAQGHGTRVARRVQAALDASFRPGEPVLFDALQALEDLAAAEQAERNEQTEQIGSNGHADAADEEETPLQQPEGAQADDADAMLVEWIASDNVVEKKSTFVAHACRVASPADARRRVQALLASDRKFGKATHNMTAFRGSYAVAANDGAGGTRDVSFQDCDDDGEDAAGGRLLHLLELTGAENVLVVVSRWYGGVKLGPDRFRIINQVAREALVRGGWVKSAGSAKRSK